MTNCIPVMHCVRGTGIDLDPDSMGKMVELMREVDSSEALVGWYSVGGAPAAGAEPAPAAGAGGQPLLNDVAFALHEYFSGEAGCGSRSARGIAAKPRALALCSRVRSRPPALRHRRLPPSLEFHPAAGMATMSDCPVHLAMDASMATDSLPFAAFVNLSDSLANGGLALFEQVPVTVVSSEAERVALDALAASGKTSKGSAAFAALSEAAYGQRSGLRGVTAEEAGSVSSGASRGTVTGVPRDLESVVRGVTRLATLLEAAQTFVDDVSAGKRAADPAVGASIAEALSAVPRLPAETVAKAVRGGVSDLVMTSFLTSLTAAQLALSERIASAVPLA